MRTELGRHSGFTLIELMLVVAIIGLLAAIALPKFSGLIRKAKEATILGRLGSIRSGLTLYYADNEGEFPNALSGLVPKYFDDYYKIFSIAIYPYGSTPLYLIQDSLPPATAATDRDWGGPVSIFHCSNTAICRSWTYAYSGIYKGDFRIACNHTDSKDNIWSTY